MKDYDVIIVGAGPGAMTAGLYTGRYQLKTLIIGQIPGGMTGIAHKVCNFPSYEEITGMELMMKMINQVKKIGIEIKQETVIEIKKGKEFEVITDSGKYKAKKIILATGSERRKLGLKNEEEFIGKGISYCATCDSGFYNNKTVGVVGGSDSALTAALLLAKYAKQVYIIYRKDKFERAEPSWLKEVEKEKKINSLLGSEIIKIIGKEKLTGVKIKEGKKEKTLELDGLFIEIGSIPNTKLSEQLGLELDKGHIKVDKNQKTNVAGIFAAGDITDNPLKQAITACGEGAVAAYSIYKELKGGTSEW